MGIPTVSQCYICKENKIIKMSLFTHRLYADEIDIQNGDNVLNDYVKLDFCSVDCLRKHIDKSLSKMLESEIKQ